MKDAELLGLGIAVGFLWLIAKAGPTLSGLGAVCPNCGLGSCPTQTPNQTMARSGCAAPAIASAHTTAALISQLTGGPPIPPMSAIQPPVFMDIPSVPPTGGMVQAQNIMRLQVRNALSQTGIQPKGVSPTGQVAIFSSHSSSPALRVALGPTAPATTRTVVAERTAAPVVYTEAPRAASMYSFEDINV